ncbi:uncharacterized protein LOC114302562 isoform X2 [Camellia sinensis]|uniref:uncharacterized protein LOC114302562 isoform X2 n=1 Tax=Camellia sinensis TaxID=4442 RepID=UPI0010358205|nr:uncharacterized protein LOC114302562 isoform X2 [Camellia sinensis]
MQLSEASGSCLDYGYSRIMSKPKSQPSDSSDDNQITEGTLVVEAAKIAAISIVDMQNVVEEDSESSKEDDMEGSAVQGEVKMRMINSIRLLWINWRRLGSTKVHTRFPKGSWRSMEPTGLLIIQSQRLDL